MWPLALRRGDSALSPRSDAPKAGARPSIAEAQRGDAAQFNLITPAAGNSPFTYTFSSERRRQLADLAARIERLRTRGPRLPQRCPSGLPGLDRALGGGLARGAVHELIAPTAGVPAHTLGLRIAAAAACEHGRVVYIDTLLDFYPPAAVQLGLPLNRLVLVRTRRPREALWAAEQALRCRGVAAVVLPVVRIESTFSRRLQLAAEAGGSLGVVVLSAPGREPTFAATRLRLDPPGAAGRVSMDCPASGQRAGQVPPPCPSSGQRAGCVRPARAAATQCVRITILKMRAGRPPPAFILDLERGAALPDQDCATSAQRRERAIG